MFKPVYMYWFLKPDNNHLRLLFYSQENWSIEGLSNFVKAITLVDDLDNNLKKIYLTHYNKKNTQ